MKNRIAMIIAVLLLFGVLSTEAIAKITIIGHEATYTQGSITLHIKDNTSGKTTTGILTAKRNNTIPHKDMHNKPSTWYCSLDIIGENYHNLRLNQEAVTTMVDVDNMHLVMNFSLSYTQHANYTYSKAFNEEYYSNARLNFYEYGKVDVGPYTIPSGFADNDVERTINWQVSALQMGLITGRDYQLCTGASSTIEYERPSYKVTFVDDAGKLMKEQTVLRGDKASPPVNPSKEGYHFAGWDKPISNVKENMTVAPRWILKDPDSAPVFGEDALSVHMNLNDDAQTFYVPNIDTELINPNIE